jgi:hypothetical protein
MEPLLRIPRNPVHFSNPGPAPTSRYLKNSDPGSRDCQWFPSPSLSTIWSRNNTTTKSSPFFQHPQHRCTWPTSSCSSPPTPCLPPGRPPPEDLWAGLPLTPSCSLSQLLLLVLFFKEKQNRKVRALLQRAKNHCLYRLVQFVNHNYYSSIHPSPSYDFGPFRILELCYERI